MTWTINGTDPRTLGLIVAETPGWADDAPHQMATVKIPGRAGVAATALAPEEAARTLVARGIVDGGTAAGARTALDKLRALFNRAPLSIAFTDNPTRAVVAELEHFTITPPAGQMIASKLPIEIGLTCRDPYFYDTASSSTALTSADALVALGTAPVRPVLTITGAATNPVITVKKNDGTPVETLALTLTTVAGDVVVIDCAALTITKNGVGILSALSGGDFLVLDPAALGDYASSAWPKVSIAGLGTGTASIAFKKAWRG